MSNPAALQRADHRLVVYLDGSQASQKVQKALQDSDYTLCKVHVPNLACVPDEINQLPAIYDAGQFVSGLHNLQRYFAIF